MYTVPKYRGDAGRGVAVELARHAVIHSRSGRENGGPRPVRGSRSGHVSLNSRFWLNTAVGGGLASRPELTISGHSVEYAVQQVDTEKE